MKSSTKSFSKNRSIKNHDSGRVIIYLRHGEDRESSMKHDQKLTQKGKDDSYDMAHKLISKYGIPDVIYCSPFFRTRQTRYQMLKAISRIKDDPVKTKTDSRLGRFFTSSQQRRPEVRDDTYRKNVSIYETWEDFKDRVADQLNDMKRKNKHKVIWCIGHTLIIKQIAKLEGMDRPKYIEFLDTAIVNL